MSGAMYVGRVGALAVALGIGAVIAGVPGVAWAGPEDDPDPSGSPGTSQSPSGDGSDLLGMRPTRASQAKPIQATRAIQATGGIPTIRGIPAIRVKAARALPRAE